MPGNRPSPARRPKVRADDLRFTPTQTPSPPCGACRQVINEFGPDPETFSYCEGPGTIRDRLGALLPHAFGPKNLR